MNEINLKIDQKINSWINTIPIENQYEICNKYLKLGYIASNLCNNSINPENSIFKNINNDIKTYLQRIENNNDTKMQVIEAKISGNLDRVKTSIDKLSECNSKSILKGNLGENIIENIIQKNFPDDSLMNMSKTTGASDYHLQMPNGEIMMFEIKNYKNVIPKKEIDKFKRDMKKCGHKIGIFISLNSSIVGKKRLEIENINDKQKIIYIPNSGIQGIPIIWAILLGKELLNIQMEPLTLNHQKIMEIYENFELIYKQFCQVKYTIQDSKDVIEKQMNKLNREVIELDIFIYSTLKNTSNIIRNELHFSDSLLQRADYNECEAIIEEMNRNGDKRVITHSQILQFCKENNLVIKFPVEEKLKWIIYDNDGAKELIRFKITKSKVDFLIEDSTVTVSGNKRGLNYVKKNII